MYGAWARIGGKALQFLGFGTVYSWLVPGGSGPPKTALGEVASAFGKTVVIVGALGVAVGAFAVTRRRR
jgi:hypothetical protein